MKKIVIDINILMDFLFKRNGHEKVAEIFKKSIITAITPEELLAIFKTSRM